MTRALKSLAYIILLSVVIVSCKKKDDEVVPAPTKSQRIVGTWNIKVVTIDPGIDIGNGVIVTDLYSQMDACDKDDIEVYNTNNSYTWEEGATKCDPSNPQVIETGTWAFNSDETLLLVTNTSGTTESTIQSLTSTQMILKQVDNINGINYTYTATFAKQ